MQQDYLPRVIDKTLSSKLKLYGAVLLEGCKWCGKSTTARQVAKSVLELQNPETIEDNLELSELKPSILLEGEKPRLIDEWQDAPKLWDAIRYDVDRTNLAGQYILTGSATPNLKDAQPRHTGIGRIIRLTMRPMSLFESNDSTGEVSLKQLFEDTKDITGKARYDLEDYAYLCARGGWPVGVVRKAERSTEIAEDYLRAIIDNDIQSVDHTLHNPAKMQTVVRSLARNVSQPVNYNTILGDIKEGEDATASAVTIKSYINALDSLHILDNVVAWSPQLRSRTEIRTTSKLNLVDPSLAVAALFASEYDLIRDFRTFGLIFESLCMRDLKIYAQGIGGDVFYYRDSYGRECDAIVHLSSGKWGAIEIKLGTAESIEVAAENLIKFREAVNTDIMSKPSFLMVITATRHAYKRDDGVLVVPIGCLRD